MAHAGTIAGSERGEGVVALALEPVELERIVPADIEIAGGDVVDDGVTGDVVERLRERDAASALADHRGELDLPVELRGFRRHADRIIGPDHRVPQLEEHVRLALGLGGEHRPHLVGMLDIVRGGTEDALRAIRVRSAWQQRPPQA